MGSSGSGSFSDYPGSKGGSPTGGAGGGAGADGVAGAGGAAGIAGATGGAAGADKCTQAFSTELEDVEQSPYYGATGSLPPLGTPLTIAHQKRIVAVDDQGRVVGNLPTALNHLAECLEEGFSYSGQVTSSNAGPPSLVEADFAPNP